MRTLRTAPRITSQPPTRGDACHVRNATVCRRVVDGSNAQRNALCSAHPSIFTSSTRLCLRSEHSRRARHPMVYLPPPHLASASRTSYAEAYAKILAAHRRSPKTAAASVIILVSPDVDALCASKMLADLFKQDDVMHRIIPVSGHAELERVRDEMTTNVDVSPLHAHDLLFSDAEHSCTRL